MLEAYEHVPMVRAVASKIATSVAAVPWCGYRYVGPAAGERSALDNARSPHRVTTRRQFVRKLKSMGRSPTGINRRDDSFAKAVATGEVIAIPNHPVVELLSNASEFLTGSEIVEVMQASLELTGNAFGILRLEAKHESEGPKVIDPVPSHAVTKLPTLGQAEPYFEVNVPDSGVRAFYPAERMLWIKTPSPRDPFGRGVGVLAAAATEIDADEAAARTLASRYSNGGLPQAVIYYKGASELELMRLERLFTAAQQGWENAGKPHFTAREIEIKELDSSIESLEIDSNRKVLNEMIRMTVGIPPEVLGIIENSNRATIDAAAFLFALFILIPRLDHWADTLNSRVIRRFPEVADSTFVWYESPLPEDMEARRAMMGTLPEAFTRNEVRRSVGLADREEEDGDALLEGFEAPAEGGGSSPFPPKKKPDEDEDEDA
jgi:HK97 family phage portal protein